MCTSQALPDSSVQSSHDFSSSSSGFKHSKGWESIAAGALSGTITSTLLQPFDVIKTRQQQPIPDFYRGVNVYNHLRKTEGYRGLFRGSIPAALRIAPGAGFYFWSLEQVQSKYRSIALKSHGLFDSNSDTPPALFNALSSGICRMIAVVAFAPLLFIKTRVESSIEGEKAKTRGRMWRVISYTFKNEGFKGFFTGLTAAMVRDIPFAAIYFVLYIALLDHWGCSALLILGRGFRFQKPFRIRETKGDGDEDDDNFIASRVAPLLVVPIPTDEELNNELEQEERDSLVAGPIGMAALEKLPEKDETISPYLNFMMASIAGILASIATHPFDVIRTQMQLWTYKPEGSSLVIISEEKPKLEIGTTRGISKLPAIGSGGNRALVEAFSSVPTIATERRKLKVFVPEPPPPPRRPIPQGARIRPEIYEHGTRCPGLTRFIYNLVQTEGYSVFWRGLMPRLARRTLATALAWTAFEDLNQRFVSQYGGNVVHCPTTIRRD